MKASVSFQQGILASAMMITLVTASPMSYGQSTAQTPNQPSQKFETNSPQHWLEQARQMTSEGRLEVAEQYVQLAESLLQKQPIADLAYTPQMAREQIASMRAPAASSAPTEDLQAASSALLAARRAIAIGDGQTAEAEIGKARSLATDYSSIGDSPADVEQLLERQNRLAEMRAQADPDFNRQAAAFLFSQAQTLVKYQDTKTSRMLVEQSQQFQVSFTPEMGDPKQLLQVIDTLEGKSPESVAKGKDKQQVMALLSKAQLAMDQKRWSDASEMVNQAKAFGLADGDYAVDQIRPWQLELKIQNAQKSTDVATATAAFASEAAFDGGVANADFVPSRDVTRDATVAATAPVESSDSTSFTMRDDNVEPAQAQAPASKSSMDLDKIRTEQQAAFRRLQSSIYKERADAEKLLERKPTQALAKLTAVRSRIAGAQLAPETQRPLLTLIDRDITEIQAYIEENLSEIQNEERNDATRDLVERRAQRRIDDELQIQKLVEQYNDAIDERRFEEAGLIVDQANDLAPDLEVVAAMSEKYRAERNAQVSLAIKAEKDQANLRGFQSVDKSGILNVDEDRPLEFGDADEWSENSRNRLANLESSRYSSDAERNIWNTLRQTEVEGEYTGTLAEAMGQLSRQAAVNIVFDTVALEDANIQTDQLIQVPLTNPVKLENALKIILDTARLTFSVENEVIRVTTQEAKRGKTKAETYYIGDLVMPMQARRNPMDMIWNNNPYQARGVGSNGGYGALNVNDSMPSTIPAMGNNGVSTLAMAQQLGGAQGNPFGGGQQGYNNNGPAFGSPAYGAVGGGQLGGITQADFQPLIQLIQSTISSDSWQNSGTGEGTISAYPANLSLVVNNTQEVQDQIVDLLKKLRELNDVQIVIEVRFITLVDDFFERVGIDFDFALNDNFPGGVDAANGDVFAQSGVVGRNPDAGSTFAPSANLDLGFLQDSFSNTVPSVGGFDLNTAASFGFAILSDIEVFFLIQASKGNTRSNITNSPTVTMFNGQSATVTNGFQRPFVTSVTPVVGDFAVAHQPIITILPDGTNLNVSAVVSHDRRSVRMTLVPQFTQIGDVETFTFEGSQTTEISTNSFLDQLLDAANPLTADDNDEEIQTTSTGVTVQLPVIATTSVSTVVSVPDGGTILLGGIKRMTEQRNEEGLPFLSNIPYINRLFKNVGIGRTTENLMMMVTPRIIIQAEEEAKQIGDTSN